MAFGKTKLIHCNIFSWASSFVLQTLKRSNSYPICFSVKKNFERAESQRRKLIHFWDSNVVTKCHLFKSLKMLDNSGITDFSWRIFSYQIGYFETHGFWPFYGPFSFRMLERIQNCSKGMFLNLDMEEEVKRTSAKRHPFSASQSKNASKYKLGPHKYLTKHGQMHNSVEIHASQNLWVTDKKWSIYFMRSSLRNWCLQE